MMLLFLHIFTVVNLSLYEICLYGWFKIYILHASLFYVEFYQH